MSLKVMVSYASAGSGHYRAAQAVYKYLKSRYPELNLALIDALKYSNSTFDRLYSGGYSFLTKRLRFLWAISYYLASLKYVSLFINSLCRLNCQRFIELLKKNQPDIVLSTHFLSTDLVSHLKKNGLINSRLVTIITDFDLHPLWLSRNCDDYIVALEYTRQRLIERGINADKIRATGIPIDPDFFNRDRRKGSKQRPVGLLITGSFGSPLLERVVDILHGNLELLVVCGSNHRLYNRLVRKQYIGVRLFGFSEDIPSLMSEADIIITKAGGLTISEALIMELPMVFINVIPGQERQNARLLEQYGCAINARNLNSLKDIIIDLKNNPERLDLMRNNIRDFRKVDATEKICRYIMEDVSSGGI